MASYSSHNPYCSELRLGAIDVTNGPTTIGNAPRSLWITTWLVFLAGLILASHVLPAIADEWPTLRHDLGRSGVSQDCVRPPFNVDWVVTFPNEIITTRTEPIVAGGRVYAGTYSGRLHCMDAATGRERWAQNLEGPILHSPSAANGKVYTASMQGVWALEAESGKTLWRTRGSSVGYDTSPAVAGGLVLLGGRDGVFRAFDAGDGNERWTLRTEGPIRTTAAIDRDVVYFGSDDMRAYAADLKTGKLRWRSEKLFGQSLRDYYPVLAGDKLVLRSNPAVHFAARLQQDGAFLCKQAGMPDNHWQTVEQFLKSDKVFAEAEEVHREQQAIVKRLDEDPQARSCFILDRDTGRETVRVAVFYVGGCAGVAPPPVVLPDGRLLIMYRTAYSNFTHGVAPLVALGLLNVATGRVEPIRHASGRQPPWNTFWGTADEQQNFSAAGGLLYIAHQGTLSGLDLSTRKLFHIAGNRDTWGGLPAVPWALNEWHGPARGSVAIAGDRLYWITGSRLIAVRGGAALDRQPGGPRVDHRPASRGPSAPSVDEKREPEVAIDMQRYLAPPAQRSSRPLAGDGLPQPLKPLQGLLAAEVQRLVDGPRFAPLRVEPGLAGDEFFFDHSGEVFLALSLAAPHLSNKLRAETAAYLREELKRYPPHTGRCWYPRDQGRRRELYVLTPQMLDDHRREERFLPFGNLYALWLFADRFQEWPEIESRWPEIETAIQEFRKSDWRFDSGKGSLWANRYLAGLIGFVRIAERLGHAEAAQPARRQASELAASIVSAYRRDAGRVFLPEFKDVNEFDRWRATGAGGFFSSGTGHKAKITKFHELTPEVARLLADHASAAMRQYLAFVDRTLPGWYLIGEERQFHFGENFVDYPDFALDLFSARAWIDGASAETLIRWIDMPWCPGDLYYIQKLAMTLEMHAGK